MDNGLVPDKLILMEESSKKDVLILIVVDNGLVPAAVMAALKGKTSLNPYCSGQWPRTRPYKTLLIINKLKNHTKQIFTFLNRKLTIS